MPIATDLVTRTRRLPAVVFVAGYVVLLLGIPSQLVVPQIGAPGTPANLWGILGLVWWACAHVGGLAPRRGLSPIRVMVGVLVAAVLLSAAAGLAGGWYVPPGLGQSSDDIVALVLPTPEVVAEVSRTALARGLVSVAAWAGIVLVTADGLRSWKDLDRVVTILTALGAFMASLAIVQFFTGIDIAGFFQIPGLAPNSEFGAVSARSTFNRVSATATHPIEFGVVMGALMPLALHWSIGRWGRPAATLPTGLIGFALMLSLSRSAILVAALALLVLMLGWPPAWRRRTLVVLPVAVVATRAVVPGLVGTIYSLFHGILGDPSVTGRTDDYDVVWRLVGENPWLGRGLFTLVPSYYRVLDNEFLVLLIELGVLGTLAVAAFFLSGYLQARGVHHHARTSRQRHLGLVLSAALAGLVLSYATFDAFSFPMAAGVTFLLVGLSAAAWSLVRDEETASDG